MRFICVAVFFLCVVKINAGNVWLKDLISQKGLNLGYGVAVKLNESKKGKNVPLMERLSLDLNVGDVAGVNLGNPRSDGVELDFYVNNDLDSKEEANQKTCFKRSTFPKDMRLKNRLGNMLVNMYPVIPVIVFWHNLRRGKKNNGGKNMLKMMIGYKAALMASIMFAIMKVLTIKAIFLAKVALIISLIVLMLKLKDHKPMEIIEVEQHPISHESHYEGYSPHGYGHHGYGGGYYGNHGYYGKEAQSSNVYPDIVYAPSGAAAEGDASAGYASIVPSGSVQTISNARNDQDSEGKKNKLFYRNHKGTPSKSNLLSIKKYSSSAEI